jgi:hypothetical protein
MADVPTPRSCPSCAAKLDPESRFCPRCGTRLVAGETLEMNPEPVLADPMLVQRPAHADSEAAIHQVHRRPLGIHPLPLLGALGAGSFVLAIVLLATGLLVPGLILFGLTFAFLVLFVGGVRREPDAPAARVTRRTTARLVSLAGVEALAVQVWVRAGFDLLRIRGRRMRLRSRLKATFAPLGQAVQSGDQPRVEALKAQAAELELRLGETEREASAVIAAARERIGRERAPIEPTEPIPPAPGA